MRFVWRFGLATAIALAAAPVASAQQAAPAQTDKPSAAQQSAQQADQKPDKKPQKADQKTEQQPDQPPSYEETVVVSASKSEEKLINAPATMTVIRPRRSSWRRRRTSRSCCGRFRASISPRCRRATST